MQKKTTVIDGTLSSNDILQEAHASMQADLIKGYVHKWPNVNNFNDDIKYPFQIKNALLIL